MKGDKGTTDHYGADRPEYAEWMSKRSYYTRMVKKYKVLSESELTKSQLNDAKLKKYQDLYEIANQHIEVARTKYGIKRRARALVSSVTNPITMGNSVEDKQELSTDVPESGEEASTQQHTEDQEQPSS